MPYAVHLVSLVRKEEEKGRADEVDRTFQENGVELLYDDRGKISAGAKFSESDLVGIPTRMVVSPRSLEAGHVEIRDRKSGEVQVIGIDDLADACRVGFGQ